MPKSKHVLSLRVESTEHLIRLMKELADLRADLDVESGHSSVKICVYGTKNKIKNTCEKINNLVEETRCG